MKSKDQILLENVYLNVLLEENGIKLDEVPSDGEIESYLNQWVKHWNAYPDSIYKKDPNYAKLFTLESIKSFFDMAVEERDRINKMYEEEPVQGFDRVTLFDVLNGMYSDMYKDRHGIRGRLNPQHGLVAGIVQYISEWYRSEEEIEQSARREEESEKAKESALKVKNEIVDYVKSNPNNIEGIISIIANKYAEFDKIYPDTDFDGELYEFAYDLSDFLRQNTRLEQDEIEYILNALKKMNIGGSRGYF